MEGWFLGKRLQKLVSVSFWRLRSIFLSWPARCLGSFWCCFWSVFMGDHASVCHGPLPSQCHLDIDTVTWCSWWWRWWYSTRQTSCVLLCFEGILSQNDAQGEQTQNDHWHGRSVLVLLVTFSGFSFLVFCSVMLCSSQTRCWHGSKPA